MKNELGHINKITLVIDSPIKINFENIEMNKLNLLIGHNASGKSLILKFNWLITSFINMVVLTSKLKEDLTISHGKLFEFLFDNTFIDNNFSGFIVADYTNNRIEVGFSDGKVNNINLKGDYDLEESPIAVFMSKETRTFNDIDKYLMMKKLLGITNKIQYLQNEKELEKLLKLYRIYDIMFIERFISKMPIKINGDETLKNTLKINYNIELYEIDIDFENSCVVYKKEADGNFLKLSSLSAGEQSVINMFVNSR